MMKKITKKFIRSQITIKSLGSYDREYSIVIDGHTYVSNNLRQWTRTDNITQGSILKDGIPLDITGWDKEDFVDNLYEYINNT